MRHRAVLCALVLCLAFGHALATEGYRTPPPALAKIIEAPAPPSTSLSPDRETLLLIERPTLIPLEQLARAELRLAGSRFSPDNFGPTRSRPASSLSFSSLDGEQRPVTGLPNRPVIFWARWSPDSRHVSFVLAKENRLEPWVVDVASAKARRIADVRLNGTSGSPLSWLSDGSALIVARVPDGDHRPPVRTAVPAGPVIRENTGEKAPARTYQDLLKDGHDEEVYAYYKTAVLTRLGLDGSRKDLGEPAMLWGFSTSPDGRYLLVQTLAKPFSYLVPASRFPRNVDVVDAATGRRVHRVAELPLHEGVPTAFGSVPTGPRSFQWRDDAPATLAWAEALDGGDARAEAELRDRVLMLAAPFSGEPERLIDLEQRFGGILWGRDDFALVSSWWWKTRNQRSWIVNPSKPAAEPDLLWDRSWEDRYNDPGNPWTMANDYGREVLFFSKDGKSLYLSAAGASPEGDRPFLDRFDLSTRKSERLFRSEAPHYAFPIDFIDDKRSQLLISRESREEPANLFVLDLDKKKADPRRITNFPHPTPELLGVSKEMIRYERADGVDLMGTLYLPAGYDKERDGRLPVVLWAYPQEYKDADLAGQVQDSPYRFDRIGWWSPLLFLAAGYAVLDDPSMPIIGEDDAEPNDTFVEQLVSSAAAAIDELDRRGVGDRDRVAVGGHSYGAFMTANLLAHSDLFRAGIARSGAYNRTLTPFGFQAEERTFWEAPEIYFEMSPFMHAHKVDEPILLIHGDADNNSGTYPMQSERYYNALKGHGATARLVMLPLESHGYRARESILHMVWEQVSWLDGYVKNAPPREELAAAGGGGAGAGEAP